MPTAECLAAWARYQFEAVGFAMSLIHIAIATTEESQHNPPLRATERHAIDPEYRAPIATSQEPVARCDELHQPRPLDEGRQVGGESFRAIATGS